MFLWLSENIWTIIICALLAVVIGLIIFSMIKNKRNGKSSCGCGCSSCPNSEYCHKK